MRCYRKILYISYKDHWYQRGSPCQDPAGNRTSRRSLDDRKETQTAVVWSCFSFIRSGQNHLAKHSERVKKTRWTKEEVENNIREWTGLEFGRSQRAVENGDQWRKLAAKSSVVPKRPSRLRDKMRYKTWYNFFKNNSKKIVLTQ